MNPKKLKPIFSFLEKNTKYRAPLKYKLFYDQESLTKEDLNVKGSLNLWMCRKSKKITLPDNLKVRRDLDLTNTKITSLPDNLEVEGTLFLGRTNIVSLPSSLKVEGALSLRKTPLAHKHSRDEIKKMVPLVKGGIYT